MVIKIQFYSIAPEGAIQQSTESWAHGAVGSALPLQGRGLRFDSGCVQIWVFLFFCHMEFSFPVVIYITSLFFFRPKMRNHLFFHFVCSFCYLTPQKGRAQTEGMQVATYKSRSTLNSCLL